VELFEDIFHGEREKLFQKVSEQYGIMKSDYHTQQRTIQTLETRL
jgi:hypothetical protein